VSKPAEFSPVPALPLRRLSVPEREDHGHKERAGDSG